MVILGSRKSVSPLKVSPSVNMSVYLSIHTHVSVHTNTPLIHHCCCCLVTKSCSTLCNPVDCSPRGCSAHAISQTRILEWVAISFFQGSSRFRDWTHVSWTGRWILYYWATREAHTHIYIYIHTYICTRTRPLLLYRCVFVHVKKQTSWKAIIIQWKEELDFAAEDSLLVLAQSCKA